MFFGLFKKKFSLPDGFDEFLMFDSEIISGPKMVKGNGYVRAVYYVKNPEDFIYQMEGNGFNRRSDVRFDRGDGTGYIILEKERYGNKYKLALHKKKNY